MEGSLSLDSLDIGHRSGYDGKAIVSGISATIRPGELVCLIGNNGAGKSTLLRTIAGLLPAIGGQICFDTDSITAMDQRELAKRVSIVLTSPVEVQDITVTELVSLGRSPYTGFFGILSVEDHRIVDEVIETIGIGHLANRMLSTLSDGERQKAMIARALAQQTSVVLLDEPTAFLDFRSRAEILSLLRRLAKTGKSILVSTHDINFALKLASRLWFIHDKRLTEINLPLSDADREMVRQFVGSEAVEFL